MVAVATRPTCFFCGERDGPFFTRGEAGALRPTCARCLRPARGPLTDPVALDDLSLSARAVWLARQGRGRTVGEIAELLDVHWREVARYAAIDQALRRAVACGLLTVSAEGEGRRDGRRGRVRRYHATKKRWSPPLVRRVEGVR